MSLTQIAKNGFEPNYWALARAESELGTTRLRSRRSLNLHEPSVNRANLTTASL